MTDPVDTDALRRLAHDVEHGWDTETGPSIRAAADEVDRLRASNATLQAAIQEIQLRSERRLTMIENAPHGPDCSWPYDPNDPAAYNDVCDCWKAETR